MLDEVLSTDAGSLAPSAPLATPSVSHTVDSSTSSTTNADALTKPETSQKYLAAHETMLSIGGKPMLGIEELEVEVREGEERERREAETLAEERERQANNAADDDDTAAKEETRGDFAPLDYAPSGSTSDGEIERMLVDGMDEPEGDEIVEGESFPLSSIEDDGAADGSSASRTAWIPDVNIDGESREDQEEDANIGQTEYAEGLPEPPDLGDASGLPGGLAGKDLAEPEEEGGIWRGEVQGKQESSQARGSGTNGASNLRILSEFWRANVSRLYPPEYWLTQWPLHLPTSATLPVSPSAISCTLTLRLPDASQHVFEVPASEGHTTRKAVKNAAAGLVLASPTLLETAKKQGEELGPEDEAKEKAKRNEGKEAWETVEKPYETLAQAAQKWMAPGEIKWAFQTDQLNTTHGCILHVPVSSSDIRTYTTPPLSGSHRDAKDAAARLALKDDIPKLWEEAYRERLQKDSGGYLTVSGAADTKKERKDGKDEQGGETDPLHRLRGEVRAAFGGVKEWLTWATQAVAQQNPTTSKPMQPRISANVTVIFPATAAFPTPPPPFIYDVPPTYLTKQHALDAAALAAFRGGIVDKLKPYQEERVTERVRREEERKKEQKEKREREKKEAKPLPKAGTVPWDELETLASGPAYLNLCAQQWTGNGQPLVYEYRELVVDRQKKSPKHHGCAVSVFINPTLTKKYTITPSEATLSRAAAKEAVVRLAFRQRVLDLLRPADFDPAAPSTAEARKNAKHAKSAKSARDAEGGAGKNGKEKKKKGKGSEDFPAAFASNSAPPSVANGGGSERVSPPSAVAYLDESLHDWLGAGCLPHYDVRQNETGLFGAVLSIALPAPDRHNPQLEPKSYWIDFSFRDRTAAQEALANVAIRDGVVEQIKREVPQFTRDLRSRGRAGGEPASGRGGGGRGLGPFGSVETPAGREEVASGGQLPSYGPARLPSAPTQETATATKRSLVPAAASTATATPSAAPFPLSDSNGPPLKKQRVWGAPTAASSEAQAARPEDGRISAVESAGPGTATSTLLHGLRAKLGDEPSISPKYKVVEDGSLFGASVSIALSTTQSDYRNFAVPATFSSSDFACEAAASAALSAGILDLIESFSRVPEPSKLPKMVKKEREQKKQVVRSEQEQEKVSTAAYGGLGGVGAKLSSPAEPSTTIPAGAFAGPSASRQTSAAMSDALQKQQAKRPEVLALEAHCTSHALPAPIFTRLVENDKPRIWVVVGEQKFELPKVPEQGAEERLASMVLKRLQKEKKTAVEGKKA